MTTLIPAPVSAERPRTTGQRWTDVELMNRLLAPGRLSLGSRTDAGFCLPFCWKKRTRS